MDINYFIKIQNAYGTKSKREKELAKVNREMGKHFEDTFDTENVLINGQPKKLMIIKDTDGNTFKKKIKSVHDEKFNLGDYVIWNNQYWLITLLDPDEKTWNRGYMYLCTIPLRWQNSSGEIIERYAYSEDFTKYSGGVSGNNTIQVGDNQYGLTLPIDEETKKLKRDLRFPIDLDDAVEPDIYALTNRKVNLNNDMYFGRGGIMTVTLSFNAFSKDEDKRVTLENGNEVWICNYHKSTTTTPSTPTTPPEDADETTDLFCTISGGTSIRVGRKKVWTTKFTDINGVEITDQEFTWNVVADFEVNQTVADNKIQLIVDDETAIGGLILLQVIVDGSVVGSAEITVQESY